MFGEQNSSNRASWEAAIRLHNIYKGHLAKEIVSGQGYIPNDVRELFPDLAGKRVVQLFCNDGKELLTLCRMGATRGLGVDFAPAAVDLARQLTAQLGYNCKIEHEEVSAWLMKARHPVADVIYTSLGSIWWVADIRAYFRAVARLVKGGGVYILWDFHPLIHALDEDTDVVTDYPFERIRREHSDGVLDYVGREADYVMPGRNETAPKEFRNPHSVSDYLWGLGEIVSSAHDGGWSVERLVEYPYVAGERYLRGLVDLGDGRFGRGPGKSRIPLTFALVLSRRGRQAGRGACRSVKVQQKSSN